MVLYTMFGLIKKVVSPYSLLLKKQKCTVRKVVVDNIYMTFPYKIKVDKCVGSCNDVELILKFVYLILLKISV